MKKFAALAVVVFVLLLVAGLGHTPTSDFENTLEAAKRGDAMAQFRLGLMYNEGRGVPKSSARAMEWFQKIEQQGNAKAQWNLGRIYFYGTVDLPQDQQKGCRLWRTAARQRYTGTLLTDYEKLCAATVQRN